MADDENIRSAALLPTYLGGGVPPCQRGISRTISFSVPGSFFIVVAEGVFDHVESNWLRRMKMAMVPDMTEEIQPEVVESPSFVKMGLRTGRQALMTPRRASRHVKRARREKIF